MNLKEVLELREQLVARVAELLGLPADAAVPLLRFFLFQESRALDAYFSDPAKVRRDVGLLPEGQEHEQKQSDAPTQCLVCYDEVPRQDGYELPCQHFACDSCWRGFCESALRGGREVLQMRCVEYKCRYPVPESLVLRYLRADTRERERYDHFRAQELVDGLPNLRNCPAPGCELVVRSAAAARGTEVRCQCGHFFCFTCGEEAHRPASCDDTRQWLVKSSSEAENTTWIIANTKTCPKCKVQIEKNQGCNHMTCRNCRHEFCWLCKGDWKEHGSGTGGYYKCNRYQSDKAAGKLSKEEEDADRARSELQRYIFYYSRFDNHARSMRFAEKTLKETEKRMKRLQDMKGSGALDVQFLINAVATVIECRRMLRWTYTVGYYMEAGPTKDLFETLQQNLEEYTERLHGLAEKPLEQLVSDQMRAKVIALTESISTFKGNIQAFFEDQ
ncbi:MAG: hypothetical protein MHM6MM_002562 [Cercozoa sp. M6MM]